MSENADQREMLAMARRFNFNPSTPSLWPRRLLQEMIRYEARYGRGTANKRIHDMMRQ